MAQLSGHSETSLSELVASFQAYNYIYVAIATFWTYDYCITFDKELSYLRYATGRKVKAWYMLTRTLPFMLLPLHLYYDSLPPDNESRCILLDNVATLISILIIVFSDVLFAIRTWALWNRKKIIVFSMLTLAVALS
ncbi:hypothetical protein CONPUDRAFT_148295 [Coniophora puteana RWD-64-598 SS2]|uniref:DUF6533 domain-containing protein n=1 Tax=Coniophora puteana (strain RWD-64-598) TaxID=741705 RepID=A0A5M3N4G9_CONPW|nr:uncharacterized protein CONPUDRAFT_148295 [Coniophora puteana RWD-64-598 SS2]EIW86196.1 hypothetical protein CONPUDRAFT_148295 [Coniophora puteana RWD-64-598 SS2]